jgi:exopolysaccharide production protein ExoZ
MRVIASIQYLRGFAASAVVIHHLAARYELPVRSGAAGVDIFFVISGFIMWLVARRSGARPSGFLRDRCIRVVPIYWLVSLALALAAALRPNLFPLDHPTLSHVGRSLLFIPHHSPHSQQVFPLLIQGWTLNYEMFFYGLFALTLLLPRTDRPWPLTALLLACVAAGTILAPRGPALLVYTSPLLLEFLAGVWLASAWEQESWISAKLGWASLVIGLILFAAMEFAGVDANEPLRVLDWGIPAFLIVCGGITIDRHGSLPRLPMLEALGNASYSIYLTHFLAILAVSILVQKLSLPSGAWVYGGSFAVALITGVACFTWIERPLTRLVRTVMGAFEGGRAPAPQLLAWLGDSSRHRIRPG